MTIPVKNILHPTVSVIIPVYNVESYLRQCLDSVVNQTLRDIEIICVNDGSTDGSPAILEEYRKKDPRITVISQENRGLSAARNRGMERMRGKYVCFLDSDDWLEPETLEKTVPIMEGKKLDALVFGRIHYFESEELRSLFPESSNTVEKPTDVYTGVKYLKFAKDNGLYLPTVWNKLWRHSFLSDNSLWFKEGIIFEDNLFCFLALMTAKRVLQIPDAFYHYRIRYNSITTRPKSHENVRGLFACAEGMLAYAYRGPHSPEEDHEIRRAYASMIGSAKQHYLILSPEEQAKVVFQSETTTELFRQTVLNSVQIDELKNRLQKISPLGSFQENDIRVVQHGNVLALSNSFDAVPVRYAWYVYKENQVILKQMYTKENSSSFSYEFTEPGSYKIQAFIRTMDKTDTRSIAAVNVTVDQDGLKWK